MARLLAIVALFILSTVTAVVASPCIAFDANFNLHAFGFGDKDWTAGTQDTWLNSEQRGLRPSDFGSCICCPGSAPTDITKVGRP